MPELEPIDFPVPSLGERNDIPNRELPVEALRLCKNMMRTDQGTLKMRPGYTISSSTTPDVRIMGGIYFRNAAFADHSVAGTKTGWWRFDGTDWLDISGTALTGGNTDLVRFQVFGVSGTYKVLGCNGVDTTKIWAPGDATYAEAGGALTAKDITAAANRVLQLINPDNIRISEFNDPETYPTGGGFNVRLVDAGDIMVGMERLNRTAVGILGEGSQYVAQAQLGSSPFRFQKVSEQPGPVSRGVIVRVGSVLYYLAEDFNVYRFDGVSNRPVGFAMRRYVQQNMSYANRGMAHGVYVPSIWKVFFFFPGASKSSPDLGVFYDIRTGEMGRLQYGTGITAAWRWRTVSLVTWDDLTGTWDTIASSYPTWEDFGQAGEMRELFGDVDGKVHVSGIGDGSDNGNSITLSWEHPLKPYGGSKNNFVPSTFEPWFKKTSNSITVTPSVGSTDTLMSDPSYTTMSTFDLSTDQRNDTDLTSVGEKRFVSVKFDVTASKGGVEYLGGLLHGGSTGVEKGPTNA